MIRQAIEKAFKFKSNVPEKENVYTPRIQSTVQVERVGYNETMENVYRELTSKYKTK